ncbi:MAG TPA: hypothetical protein VF857_03795 [Spirochaetota bacterium]
MKPALFLRHIESQNNETMRIHAHVHQTVESFNAYVSDFLESISITAEELDKAHTEENIEEKKELQERIAFLNHRITELIASMKDIALHIPSIVEYHEE